MMSHHDLKKICHRRERKLMKQTFNREESLLEMSEDEILCDGILLILKGVCKLSSRNSKMSVN